MIREEGERSYAVEIIGRRVKVNGEEIENVSSVHFAQDREGVPRTVVEVDGDFSFAGLSRVEFVFHPSSVEEAGQAMRFYAQTYRGYRSKLREAIELALEKYRTDDITTERLSSIILERVLEVV